jgi:hypothetical protein
MLTTEILPWRNRSNKFSPVKCDDTLLQALLEIGTLVTPGPASSDESGAGSETDSHVDGDYYVLELMFVTKKEAIPLASGVPDSETSNDQDDPNIDFEILLPVTKTKGGLGEENIYKTAKEKEVVASLTLKAAGFSSLRLGTLRYSFVSMLSSLPENQKKASYFPGGKSVIGKTTSPLFLQKIAAQKR